MTIATTITRSFTDPADTITLDETARHRRRIAMRSDGCNGTEAIEFMLDLPEARLLRHGDGLVLDDGRVIEVRAAPEALYEIRACDATHLIQLAWQLGNRHLPAQIYPDRILIRRDLVIGDMIIGLGGTVQDIDAPFDPEAGAYGQVGGHADDNPHDHDHGHAHR